MPIEQIREERLKQLKFLEERGINPYPPEIPLRTHHNSEIAPNFEVLKGDEVSIVGRMMAVRDHGNRFFFDLDDESGRVQITFDLEKIGEEMLEVFKEGYGVGDFIGIRGEVIKTKSGQVTIDAKDITMLAKSILPPPFRLKDREELTRKRYLDMLLNIDVVERFKFRSLMVQEMRNKFLELDCWEVETPIMDSIYGGASAKPFITHHNALGTDLYLRISNELYLKKLVIGGLENVFEFSRDFRNEGMDKTHNPEFTQVELYMSYKDYFYMMDMSETLMSEIAQKLLGTTEIIYQGEKINLSAPWRRLTVNDGVRQYAGIDLDTISNNELLEIAKRERIKETDKGYIVLELFGKYAEPHLIQPTFVMDYPESTSPLTKKHRTKPGQVERFECYIGGWEVMNCYTELNDPRVQRRNFEAEERRRLGVDSTAMLTDNDFLTAMEHGMPPMGGIGISIDRWAMIFTNSPHIRDVITFPVTRPLEKSQD